MRYIRPVLISALMAAITSTLVPSPALSLSLTELLGGSAEKDNFKVIHVADLKALMGGGKVQVFDANGPETREKWGVIPGAKLLSSSDDYDIATTLPSNKDTKLVFYCADWL
jgi:hypothetical protein